MNPAALVLLMVAVVLIPGALIVGGFNGLTLLGVLAAVAAIVLAIIGAPWVADDETSARLDAVDRDIDARRSGR